LKPRPDSSATHACTSGCRIAATGTAPKRGKMYELKYASSRDTADGLQVVSDERVNQLTGKEREAANRVPTGSALKLRRRAQLIWALRRARNRPGGYWVAAADPEGRQPGRHRHGPWQEPSSRRAPQRRRHRRLPGRQPRHRNPILTD
jgi:hypothetical protein